MRKQRETQIPPLIDMMMWCVVEQGVRRMFVFDGASLVEVPVVSRVVNVEQGVH